MMLDHWRVKTEVTFWSGKKSRRTIDIKNHFCSRWDAQSLARISLHAEHRRRGSYMKIAKTFIDLPERLPTGTVTNYYKNLNGEIE